MASLNCELKHSQYKTFHSKLKVYLQGGGVVIDIPFLLASHSLQYCSPSQPQTPGQSVGQTALLSIKLAL